MKFWLNDIPTEYEEQKNLARWLDSRMVLWTATANGGSLRGGAQSWAKLKSQGVKNGVPDILVFEPRLIYNGIAIELKRRNFKMHKNNHLSVQAKYLKDLESKGWFTMFACGAEEAIAVLSWYLTH